MKQFRLSILLTILMSMVGAKALAYDAKINGIYYNLSSGSKTAYITYQKYVYTYVSSSIPSGYDYYVSYDEDSGDILGYYYYYSDCNGSITIPSNVTYNGITYDVVGITNNAFENCSATSITIPNTITSVSGTAFRKYKGSLIIHCPLSFEYTSYDEDGYEYTHTETPFAGGSFSSVSLGNEIPTIPDFAFRNCSNLSSISIPNSVSSIGSYAFNGCSKISSLILPSSLTGIGAYAFHNCSNLAIIDINATSLTSIGNDAFGNCSNLQTVNLNSISSWMNCSLGNANSSPFCNGADLYVADEEKTTISIPIATTAIPSYSFYGCKNITSVTIPALVNSIGEGAFSNCLSLAAINVNSSNNNFASEDDVLYNANKTKLLICPGAKSGALSIPSSVVSINQYACSGCVNLSSVTIPSSVTSIGGSAFYNVSGKLVVYCRIPNGNPYANVGYFTPFSLSFYNSNFNEVVIGDNVTSIGDWAFYGCSSITSITLPNSLTSVGSSAFSGCTGITSITLPNSLTSIGSSAFSGCTGITSITLPSSLSSIGNWAFNKVSGKITVNCNIPDVSSSYGRPFSDSKFNEVVIGNDVTNIGRYAFYDCSSITSVTLPNSLTSIGSDAFKYCSGINAVNVKISDYSGISSNNTLPSYLPSSATWNYYINDELVTALNIPSSVTSIGDYAFYNAKGITSVTLPNSLTSIGSSAFQNCSGITSITLPSTMTSIGSSAFQGCTGITTVNVNSDISSNSILHSYLQSSATWNYYINDELVTALNIPSSVTSIGDYAFYNAKGITSVTMPNTLASIGKGAFSGCIPIAFICNATNPPTLGSNNAFGGKKKIYVPFASIDTYKRAWSQLSTSSYTYLPLLDVMFFDTQTAESYAAELNGKDKSGITSVAFYEGGIDGTLTETVMKNGMNPNCLYYMPASAGLNGDNIVSLDDYEAESVTLTDNYTYDCPIPFHTEEIKYVHNPSVWANGSAGWETICLPFEPVSFRASERGYISPIMLGSTGNFWLRKFVGASSDAVYFTSTLDGRMEANTPYLVAFPGSTMGTGHLEGQTITFQGHDADIAVSRQPEVQKNDFVFVGNYDTTADGIEGWALNAVGNSFTKNSNVGNQPFRAYFKNLSGDASSSRLRISFSDPTDIRSLEAPTKDFTVAASSNGTLLIQSDSNRSLNIYSIDGRLERRVELSVGENCIEGLHKGLYIVENQKVNVQ